MLATEAEELVDVYGSDPKRWPAHHKADMEALMRSNPSFRDYVNNLARLDAMLDDWESGEDGTKIDEEDENGTRSPPEDPEDDPEDEEEGDEPEDEDDEAEDDPDADDDDGTIGGAGEDPEEDANTDEEAQGDEQPEHGTDQLNNGAGAPLEVDFEDLKDTDGALEDILREMMFGGFNSQVQTHFTRDYDTVEPYEAPKHVPGLEKIEAQVKQVAGALQKDLQRIMVARSQSYFIPGFRSGRLNAPSLHRLKAGDDRVFRRRHVAETNKVAVSLVVDLSGSMSGSKCKTALMAAWAFSEILDKLGVANEVCGFTTGNFPQGFKHAEYQRLMEDFYKTTGLTYGCLRVVPVWMPIFKAYSEKFTPETKRRLADMAINQGGMGSNNDAAAIEFAGERLRRRSESRKIMIVFSDGMPADGGVDYATLNNSVKTNIATLEKQGMEVVGIGIESNAVKHFYKKCHVIQNVKELPKFVMGELKQLLTH